MRSNSRRGIASVRKGSSPKIRAAIRPLVDALERRLLLSGTLPSFVQASTDANYTLDNSSGSMVMDLNSGSLVVNADLSTATGWSNATVRLHNGAHIYFNSAQTLGDLELHDSTRAVVALGSTAASGNLLQLSGFSIDRYSKLDLGDNSMILHYAPSQEAADNSMVFGLLARGSASGGWNQGPWTGYGIYSSAAANDASQKTALGFGDNNVLHDSSFAGVSLTDDNEILIRYTLYGDSNLDGVVADSTAVDPQFQKGVNGQGTGWSFGDYNYDGITAGSADASLFTPNTNRSISQPQFTPSLQIQPLSFTAYEYTPWSGDVATFSDSSARPSYSASDYTATIDWGGFVDDAQVTQPLAGSDYFRVNAQTAGLYGGPFTIQIAYAAGGPYTGAPASMAGMIDALQLPNGAIPTSDASYTLSGSPGAIDLNVTAGTIAFNTNVANAGNYWQNLTINASGSAHIIFNSAQTLDALNLSESATVTVSQGSSGTGGNVLQLDSLSVGSTATLDLGDNSMILYYTPSDESSDVSTVQSLLTSGYNNGAWNGTGIDSSTAANDASQLTSVGWFDNNVGWLDSNNNAQHYPSFAGVSLPDSNQILVRYTLAGDANLDGVVDGTDLLQTSRGQSGTGWQYGDFNYNATPWDQGDFSIVSQNSGHAIAGSQYAPAFNLSPLPVQPNWNTPFDGDIATFTDTVNRNLPASDYLAEVYWGDGNLSIAQVTATSTPGSFRINAISPVFTSANPVMLVTLQYSADSGYQSESAIAGEPIDVLQLPPGVNASADAAYSLSGVSGSVQLNLTAGSLAFDTNVGSNDSNYFQNLSFIVSGSAHAYFNAPQNFNALDIQNNAIVSVSKGSGGTNGNLLDVQSLSIDPNATLDLSDNGLIESYDSANEPAAATQMNDWLTSGYNGGLWTGPGIDSSVAAADSTHTTGLGWLDNNGADFDTFDGIALNGYNQLLAQYTLDGDADLSGTMDGTDLSQFFAGRAGQGTGWVFGDSNYDGITDSTDQAMLEANMGRSMTGPTYARAFQPAGIVINPIEGVPFSGDIATFTDLLNPSNTDPSIYQAQVNWGDGGFVAAQVTATNTPGSFRINALSPALTDPNAMMGVIIEYADMNDPSPTYQGRPAAVIEPILFAPAAPLELTVAGVTDTEIDLTWTQGSSNTPAASYTIYRNGQAIGTTTALAYEDTGLVSGTQYTYRVDAVSSTGASSSSQQIQATTTSVLAGTTPPASPTNISSSSNGAYVTLTWSGGQNLEYEVERNGVDIALANTTTYTDSGAMPWSVNTYSIIAYDPTTGNLSQPASYTTTTGNDNVTTYLTSLTATTAANGPITLNWDQPADPGGVASYIVTRSQQGYGSPTTFPNVYTTTFTDSTAVVGTTYQYSVTEYNDSGGHSQPASVSVTAGIPPVDQATGQDIPQSYMDYFYNSLTKTFRELDAYSGDTVTPPPAQGWFDPGIDVNVTALPGYHYGEFQSGVYQVFYNDHNGNGTYDPGESLWYSQFAGNTFASGDRVLAGPTPPVGALGTNSGTPFYFVDENGNGEADASEIIPKDANQLQGIEGQLAYRDIGGIGYWTPSDPIWYDANGNSKYDDGEEIIYEPVTPQPGDWGKKNGLAFYDMQGSGHWDPNDPVWADQNSVESDGPSVGGTTDPQTVFRADFAAFYPAVESLIPSFIDSNNAGQESPPALTLQDVFQDLGMTDWTKVPATTGPDGISFSYVAGKPDANSAVFPVQFQELSSVLSKLTTIPGFRFTKSDSDEFNATAQLVLGAYGALFGQNDSSQIALTQDVTSGYTSPGALESGTWSLLEGMANRISGAIYARQDGAWVLGTDSNPETFSQYDPPNFPGVSSSDGVSAENQSINLYLQAILSNGMWIKNLRPIGISQSFPGSNGSRWNDPSHPDNVSWPNYPSLPYPTPDFTGVDTNMSVGGAVFGVDQPDGYSQFGNANWVGYTLTITLPAAPSLGGLAATSLAAGPGGNVPIPADSQSGTTLTVFSMSVDQIGSVIQDLFPKTSDLQNAPWGVTTEYDVTDGDVPYAYNGVVGNPHIIQYSLYENTRIPYDGNEAQRQWYADFTLYIDAIPPDSVYGLVPDGSASVTPFVVQPPTIDRSSPPTDAIPLQSQMSLLNVVPDTNLDDIVQVDHDQTSFGNDTGSISYEMQRGMPQVYIPLNTDGTDSGSTLPIHNYLSQGGFGTSLDSVGTLLDQNGWTYSDANENGQPYSDSLDTSVNNSLLIIDAANHVKRVEVIRPRGNAVIFDFAWNSTTQQFSPYGHPIDLNSDRLYVLRDVTPDNNNDLQYDLEFPSGIVQHFQDTQRYFGNETVDVGILQSISDTNSGLTTSASSPSLSNSNPINTPRYSISAQWSGGQIVEMDYTSSISSSATIKTVFTYGSGDQITELDKTDNGSEIPEFSYLVSGDSIEQDGGAITVTRSGSMDGESGDATLTTTIGGIAGYSAETTSFSRGLITADTVHLVTDTVDSSATTTYTYANSGTSFYNNGAPKWGKVSDVTNPDGSWVHNVYDPTTGWLTDQYTPYKSSPQGDLSDSRHVVYDYNAADSGGGDGVDANSLVPLPRKATTSIGGTVVNVSFMNVQQQPSGSGSQEITRQGSSSNANWMNAALSSTTTLTGYDSYTLIGPLGTTTHTGTGLSSSTTQTSVGGAQLSSQNTTTNAFGGLTGSNTSSSSGIGQGPTKVTPGSGGTPDPFGRTTKVNVNGNTTLATSFTNYGWLGPQSVTDPTGANTSYTYTPTGQVATATIYPGGQHSVTTTYTYDVAGNVIKTVQAGTYNGQTISVTTSASYDVLGRLLSSTDALGRTTRYVYTVSSTGTTVTETLPDGSSTEVQKYALDGTLLSTTGSAVADPSTGDEGVVTSTLNEPNNVTIPAGSTWTLASTNNGSDWTKIYTNLLGQQFYTQQSGPNGVTLSTYTTYDGNGRPITFQDVDGSVTHTDYNPSDGSVLDTWVDMNGNGVYDPGVDSKTTNTITPSNTLDSQWAGTTQKDLSASGNQVTQTQSMSSGLDSETISDGLTTSSKTTFTGSDGTVTVTTTNSDGTKTVDSYSEGLLTQEQQLGTNGTTVLTTVTYGYDPLRRDISVQDWETAPTTFTLRPDGSVESMTLPDGRTETVDSQDPNTQTPTDVTRLDGQQQSQSISSTGQTTSQSGAGVTPTTYGYDPVTAQLASLTIFPSGSSTNTTGQEITGFKYDPSTSLESRKTYADGSTDTFVYNNKLQLSAENLRGASASFNYNSAGMQTGATYIGGSTGTTIYDSLGTLDDLGRSHVMTETTTSPGGATTSTSDILGYNQQGQVASEAQASGVTVHYDYNADSSIQDMKLYQDGQVISETDYAYDPISKRLATITINGVTYTYTYKTNTNLVESVGTSANTIKYTYEDKTGRIQEINATQSLQSQFDAQYTYTANDQRLTENVLQENPDTQAIDQRNWTFGYDGQDELTSVSQDGTTLYSYNYDGVGNSTDVGSFNSLNQYSGFLYNGQGDVINDGQFSYTWDSKGRLTSATLDSPDAQSQKDVFTYDPENRRTQEDIYTWSSDGQGWVYASSLKFVYNGSQMVAELNAQNQLLQTYTWGPTGTLLSITDYTGAIVKNYQVVTDGSGNVVELMDSSTGLVVASYQYDPWGNPTSATGPAAGLSPFRWQGEFYDASFGGYYMGAREGSARLRIFLSPDPSGEASDENLYRDVGNDPINKGDSTGLRFDTLLSLWNKATTIAAAMNNPTQFMADHPQIMLGVGNTIQNMAVDSVNNPQAFQAGQVIGGANAAAQLVTGPAAMVANAKDTGVRILGEAANASDEEINAAIAADQANELLRVPDQFRQQSAGQAIQFVGSAYGDPRAVQSGATFGEIGVNFGMLLTSLINLPATLDTIGEGIVQLASWASKLSEGAEAEAGTASLLSEVQSFSPISSTQSMPLMQAVESEAPMVRATFSVGGQSFSDVNPTARLLREDGTIGISGLRGPNADLSTMHAEIGSMKQALDAGVQGGEGVLVVQGRVVCQPYCTGDVKTMARALSLDRLTVLDDDGLLYHFPDWRSLLPVRQGGKGW